MAQVYLLDTNIVASYLNEEAAVVARVEAEQVCLCSIVIGELFFGAFNSAKAKENVPAVEDMARSLLVLACDAETARFYGEIKRELRSKGRPIPENDVWIAAIARQYDVVLATRDAHFQEIENLRLETW